MKIVWDEPKRLAHIAKHGLDFADLDESFFETTFTSASARWPWMAIGLDLQGVVSVVFAILGEEALSLISMRPASRAERRLYVEYQKQKEEGLHRKGPQGG